jgi:hypothetical protein
VKSGSQRDVHCLFTTLHVLVEFHGHLKSLVFNRHAFSHHLSSLPCIAIDLSLTTQG